jgi:hypothetical protein
MADLSGPEQDELRRLLEEEDVIEPPTVVFTVRHVGSNLTPETLPPIYPRWWKGREWWYSLSIAKRRDLVAQGTNKR